MFPVLITLVLAHACDAAGVAGAGALLKAGGWAGVVSSGLAFYTAAAMVINSVSRAAIMPLGALGASSRTAAHVVR